MKQYHDMVRYVLENGKKKVNRTGVATISCFSYFYRVDIAEGYPLLTTKKIFFNSMLRELLWYLSGEEHIKDLRNHTKIWDDWADSEGRLQTAYGRFWRRFPVPTKGLDGEVWSDKWVSVDKETGEKVFDQIGYIIDSLKEIKLDPASKASRRLVVSAWHPANAAASLLPPCHYTFCFNVSDGKLNCHLTQRSADIALGVPFNLACYSLLTIMLAKECGFAPGEFAHTLIDAHIYENHIDGLKIQLERTPRKLPEISIADKPFDKLIFEDFKLIGYDPHPVIKFEVAV
ncbi:MAG: thymidylate synthase [Spirochaetaceae bacterium]|nr:thymidylate synthase [Spirochaetaceae bacterium]